MGAADTPTRARRCRAWHPIAPALAALGALCGLWAAPLGAQQSPADSIARRNPADSIAALPGAAVERDTAPLLAPRRLRALPPAQRRAWLAYLRRSHVLDARARALMAAELRRAGMPKMVRAPYIHDFAVEPHMKGAWFASDSARRLADNILSWQTPAGGWSKHVDMRLRPRRAGESWFSETDEWRYIATFDNDATVTQLRILGGIALETAAASSRRYAAAFLRGLRYIRDAQYPNGCFPQVYPLQGGYHDAVTFNDNATVNVLWLLRDVGSGSYDFVPMAMRRQAGVEFRRGLACLLRAQVVVDGVRTVWGQQHDPLTLLPAPARSYELAGLSGRESAWILDFLMELPDPSRRVVAAVHAGVGWFRAHEIRGHVYEDGLLAPAAGASGLWARNTEIATGRPIMANRDGIKLYDTGRLTDRRHGYGWYGTEPLQTLRTYEGWARNHPPTGESQP